MLRSLRPILRNSAYLLVGYGMSAASRAVCIFMLVRSLAPDQYGILNYGLSWYLSLIVLTYLGQDVLLGRELGRRGPAAASLLSQTLILRALAISVVVLGFAIVARGESGQIAQVFVILSIALAARSLWMWCAAVFISSGEARYYTIIELICRWLEVICIAVYLYSYNASVFLVASIHSLSWVLQAIIGLILIFNRYSVHPERFNIGDAFAITSNGVPGAIWGWAIMWIFQWPVILFQQTVGVGDKLGQFSLAIQLVAYIYLVPSVIFGTAMPVLARSAARRDGKDRLSAIVAVILVLPFGALFAAVVSSFATEFVRSIFGSEYVPAATILADAVWILIPLSLASYFQTILLANAIHSPVGVGAPLVGLAVMAVAFPLAVDSFGSRGAILAMAIGVLTWMFGTLASLIQSGFFGRRFAADS